MTNKIFYKKLGKKIRQFREEKDLTIDELSQFINMNESFLGEVERGRKKPSIETIIKISRALDVDIYLLFKFE